MMKISEFLIQVILECHGFSFNGTNSSVFIHRQALWLLKPSAAMAGEDEVRPGPGRTHPPMCLGAKRACQQLGHGGAGFCGLGAWGVHLEGFFRVLW